MIVMSESVVVGFVPAFMQNYQSKTGCSLSPRLPLLSPEYLSNKRKNAFRFGILYLPQFSPRAEMNMSELEAG